MGCGCKGTKTSKTNETLEKEPISLKSTLKKIGSIIILSLLLVILTPFIVVLIWYFTIKMISGSDENVINLLIDKFIKNKEVNSDEYEEVNSDEYELMDVDIIE